VTLTVGHAVRPVGVTVSLPASPSPSEAQRRGADRLSWVLAGAVMGVLVVGLVASAHQRATMAFGDSHDGRNAGVWASHSRSLREDGPVATRLGTRALAGDKVTPYATHPPLIVVETALAEAVLGEHPWVTRFPAWGGSLAALVLAFLLLRACRLQPLAAAVGVALGFGGPMFATYGTMLDTTMVGLPFGIAVLWLWQRARSGRPARAPVVALVAILAALTSWLGLLTVVMVATATLSPKLFRRLGNDPTRQAGSGAKIATPATGFVVGAAVGTAAVFLWIAAAYGSLRPLIDQFLFRSGAGNESVGLGALIDIQRGYWAHVLTPWQLLLIIPAFVAAVKWRPSRAVAIVALAGIALWVGGMKDGAVHHDYWTYWMVLPLSLGLGVMAEAALRLLTRREGHKGPSRVRRSSWMAALAACATGLALVGVVAPSATAAAVEHGANGGAAIKAAAYSPGQRTAWYVGDISGPADWVGYDSRRPAVELRTANDVGRLAAELPDDLVLVDADSLRRDVSTEGPNPGCRAGVPEGKHFAVLPAATLAVNLARPAWPCPA